MTNRYEQLKSLIVDTHKFLDNIETEITDDKFKSSTGFGNNWKNHAENYDQWLLIDIALSNGRKVIVMERKLKQILHELNIRLHEI